MRQNWKQSEPQGWAAVQAGQTSDPPGHLNAEPQGSHPGSSAPRMSREAPSLERDGASPCPQPGCTPLQGCSGSAGDKCSAEAQPGHSHGQPSALPWLLSLRCSPPAGSWGPCPPPPDMKMGCALWVTQPPRSQGPFPAPRLHRGPHGVSPGRMWSHIALELPKHPIRCLVPIFLHHPVLN